MLGYPKFRLQPTYWDFVEISGAFFLDHPVPCTTWLGTFNLIFSYTPEIALFLFPCLYSLPRWCLQSIMQEICWGRRVGNEIKILITHVCRFPSCVPSFPKMHKCSRNVTKNMCALNWFYHWGYAVIHKINYSQRWRNTDEERTIFCKMLSSQCNITYFVYKLFFINGWKANAGDSQEAPATYFKW